MGQETSLAEHILPRIAAGESDAMRECLNRYGGLVWSLIRRRGLTAGDAEDLAQEIFVEIWRHADRYDPSMGAESTFIAVVTRRRLVDRVRRQSRRPTAESIDEPVPDPSSGNSSSGLLEVQEEAVRARELMTQLRSDEQKVLLLAIDEGLSQTEIAERVSMPLGTVKTLARRGLQRLRELMMVSVPLMEGAAS